MTKRQFMTKVRVMLKEHRAATLKECERLLNCGGIDPTVYADDFRLPKIVFKTALKNEVEQYTLYLTEDKKAAKNLSHF